MFNALRAKITRACNILFNISYLLKLIVTRETHINLVITINGYISVGVFRKPSPTRFYCSLLLLNIYSTIYILRMVCFL